MLISAKEARKLTEAAKSGLADEIERQTDEINRQITEACAEGGNQITWKESGTYMADYSHKLRHDACNTVLEALEKAGYDVYTERRAAPGKGAIITW